jgi:hypothetical protein
MTTRKADLPLPTRTPTYVSREVGAAELCVSPETWDAMFARGELPPPEFKVGGTMPRWRWETVQAWLSGRRAAATMPTDPYVAAAEQVGRG